MSQLSLKQAQLSTSVEKVRPPRSQFPVLASTLFLLAQALSEHVRSSVGANHQLAKAVAQKPTKRRPGLLASNLVNSKLSARCRTNMHAISWLRATEGCCGWQICVTRVPEATKRRNIGFYATVAEHNICAYIVCLRSLCFSHFVLLAFFVVVCLCDCPG